MAKICPNCEKENPSAANFCMFCMTQLIEEDRLSEEDKLRKRNAELQEQLELFKRNKELEKKVENVVPQKETFSPPTIEPEVDASAQFIESSTEDESYRTKFCCGCGKELLYEIETCPYCGYYDEDTHLYPQQVQVQKNVAYPIQQPKVSDWHEQNLPEERYYDTQSKQTSNGCAGIISGIGIGALVVVIIVIVLIYIIISSL